MALVSQVHADVLRRHRELLAPESGLVFLVNDLGTLRSGVPGQLPENPVSLCVEHHTHTEQSVATCATSATSVGPFDAETKADQASCKSVPTEGFQRSLTPLN